MIHSSLSSTKSGFSSTSYPAAVVITYLWSKQSFLVPPWALTFVPSVPKTFNIGHSSQPIFYARLSLEVLLCWLHFQFSWSLHDLPHWALSSCHHFPQMQDLRSPLQTQPHRNWYKEFLMFCFSSNRVTSITLKWVRSTVVGLFSAHQSASLQGCKTEGGRRQGWAGAENHI